MNSLCVTASPTPTPTLPSTCRPTLWWRRWSPFSEQDEPVGTGLLRWSPFASGAGSVEVKRLYVRPEHRGHGHSRVIMGALEHAAARAGAVRIVLETGVEQPEAIALYERIGYSRIPGYGEYMDDPRSVCFAKDLPTRVLVVNGTIGAGKTSVAEGGSRPARRARLSRRDDRWRLSVPGRAVVGR